MLRTSSLRSSIRDGNAQAVSVGFGETYFGPFAVFLQASALQVGIIATFPALAGAIFQGVSVWITEKVRKRQGIVTLAASLQALTLLSMAIVPSILPPGNPAALAVLIIATCYFILAGLISPPWNSLIGDLVSPRRRGDFFALRTKYGAASTFGAIIVAGFLLDFFKKRGWEGIGFVAVMLIAATARSTSAYALSRHKDVEYRSLPEHYFSFWTFIKRARFSNFAKFVLFHSSTNCAIAVAGPYFAVYMLRELQLSYAHFTLITASATLPQFLTMRYWGRLTALFGSKRILTTCTYGVAVVPFLWLFGTHPIYLCIIQMYSGAAWAGYTLAAQNFMFDAVSPPKRARCAAYQNLVNGTMVFIGSVAGGVIVTLLPPITLPQSITLSPFFVLFIVSGVLRSLAAHLLLRRFHEVRSSVRPSSEYPLVFRVSHFRPIFGGMFSVITAPARKRLPRNRKS